MKFQNILSALLVLVVLYAASLAQGRNADLLIVGGTVVTMDKYLRVLENGGVAIRGDKIVGVGTRAQITSRYRAARTIDATGKVVIPGLINTHTHVPMSLFRGIADDLDLNEWLTKYIFPAEAKNVDEAFVRAGTRLGLAEMIRGGTTTYCDMYYFEDAIADETKKAGVRGVLGETIIDFPVADNKTFDQAMAYGERFVRKWKNDPLIVAALAPLRQPVRHPRVASTTGVAAWRDCRLIHRSHRRAGCARFLQWSLRGPPSASYPCSTAPVAIASVRT